MDNSKIVLNNPTEIDSEPGREISKETVAKVENNITGSLKSLLKNSGISVTQYTILDLFTCFRGKKPGDVVFFKDKVALVKTLSGRIDRVDSYLRSLEDTLLYYYRTYEAPGFWATLKLAFKKLIRRK